MDYTEDMDFMNSTAPWDNESLPVLPPRPPPYVAKLKLANQVVLAVTFAFVTLAMGASVTPKDFKIVLRRPVGVAVGFVSQFIVLPLFGFCYALAARVDPSIAIGILVLACCPGGSLSNLYTFWTDGDLCLSIIMTTMSTLLAIGMMPLNLWIYSRRWSDEGAVIPFLDIFITLVTILVPVSIGMLIRWKKERWAIRMSKVNYFRKSFIPMSRINSTAERMTTSLGMQAHIYERGLLQCHSIQIVGGKQMYFFLHTVMVVSIALWVS